MKMGAVATCCALLCIGVFAQTGDVLPTGTVTSKVVCAGNPQQTYAVYLPSQYSTKKRWPIIYAFDPLARGNAAVEAMRAAAEKYGYIVAASNNSRNGAEAMSTEAAKAMWQDTLQRFSLDERRRYFAGMSGGARLATALALNCNCVAGVIANAAGFPQGRKVSAALKFAYFASVGNADFNFPEFIDLRRQLEETGAQYRIRIFDGQHGWAPEDVWLEALNWMDLQAMRAGVVERDPIRIQQSYDAAMQKASQWSSAKDFLAAYREYQSIAREFAGLLDVTAAQKAAQELTNEKRIKSAEKQESTEANDQGRLMAGPSAQIEQLASGNLPPQDVMALRDTLATMLRQARSSLAAKDARSLVLRRALGNLVIQAFEAGQSSMDQRNYSTALSLFDVVVAGAGNAGWGHYHRARVYAIMADKKHMLSELKLASTTGFRDASALDSPEFQAFKSDPDLATIRREWSVNAQP